MTPASTESTLLTPQQCRILLTDIACCSLMRLDTTSMDKLWDLMTMIYKWQTFIAKSSNQILDITMRHLDGIGKLIPEMRKTILIDLTKKIIFDFWNTLTDLDKIEMRNRIMKWLKPFTIKISILIRLGFQKSDGSFENNFESSEHFNHYITHIGENIFSKGSQFCINKCDSTNSSDDNNKIKSKELKSLGDQLNISIEQSHNQHTINDLFLDDINFLTESNDIDRKPHEFIHIKNNLSQVDRLLEMLNFNSDDKEIPDEFDATGELLAMLDNGTENL